MIRSIAVVALALSSAASAQTASFRLTSDKAEAIVAGCKRHALAKGQSHGIAVFDAGGNPVATLRMGGGAGVMAFAEAKARAVANWGFPTSGMEEAVKGTPGFGNAPHIVTVPGGVPIFTADGGAFLGAVGVSGEAPADDVACAEAGIAAAGLASARKR